MIQVEFKLKLGQDEFTIKAEVESQKDFFETMSFYSSLPKTGPNGETDLKVTHRHINDFDFYSIVSEEAGKEYRFGQYKKDAGSLFGKGWEPLYQKDSDGEESEDTPTRESRFSKSKKSSNKNEEVDEEPQDEEQEEEASDIQEKKSATQEQASPTNAEKSSGNSRINNLMAKYAGKKPTGSNSNLKRE